MSTKDNLEEKFMGIAVELRNTIAKIEEETEEIRKEVIDIVDKDTRIGYLARLDVLETGLSKIRRQLILVSPYVDFRE